MYKRDEKFFIHAGNINDLPGRRSRRERDALWNSLYRYRMPARISRVLGRKTARYQVQAGTYDQLAQRSIAGDTSSGERLSLPDLLSRWTPVLSNNASHEIYLARKRSCPAAVHRDTLYAIKIFPRRTRDP